MPEVHIEVVWLRLLDGALAYRIDRCPLPDGSLPDEVALALADPSGDSVEVLHSTSWRHEPGTGVVLTYAAVPDPTADTAPTATRLTAPAIVSSHDARRPRPPDLHAHHVAAHAIHHLADLAGRDPAIAARAEADTTGIWAAVNSTAALTPTGEHASVHADAARLADRHLLTDPRTA